MYAGACVYIRLVYPLKYFLYFMLGGVALSFLVEQPSAIETAENARVLTG